MSKDCTVIVLDVGENMSHVGSNGHRTDLDSAKIAFRLMIQQKLLFGYKTDLMGIVLLNSDQTNNECNEEYGDYENIDEFWKLQTPSLELLECIDSIECQNGSGDLLDALLVGAQMIYKFVGKKKYKKRIFLLSNCYKQIKDIEQINEIAASFEEQNISFNCIGIGFGEEFDDENSDDEDDEDDDDDNNNNHNKPDKQIQDYKDIKIVNKSIDSQKRPVIAVNNEKIVRFLSHKIGEKLSNVYSGALAIKMMSDLRTKSVLQRPLYSGSFDITSKIRIMIKIFTRSREAALPSLKKESKLGNNTGKVLMDRVYKTNMGVNNNNNNNNNNNEDVKQEDNDDDDDDNNNNMNGEIVEESERVKSYLYGKQRIPFTDEDIQRLDYKSGEKHFHCLGFIHSSKVPRHYFMSNTMIAVSDTKYPTSSYLLSSFINACYQKNHYILGRLVARKNASPKYVCLEPRIKNSMECFIINELPFYEDIRMFPFGSFNYNKKYQPTQLQKNIFVDFITSLNLMNASKDEDGDTIEALKPQNTFNPVLQRFYYNLQNRALDPNAPIQTKIEGNNFNFEKYLYPESDLFNNENSMKIFKRMKDNFILNVIQKKDAKKDRKHWSDLGDELDDLFGANSNNNNNNNNNMKAEEDESDDDDDHDIDINDMLQINEITKIGTINPTKDFETILKTKSTPNLFVSLFNEMWDVIYQLINQGYQSLNYNKAMDCIEFLKTKSILNEEPVLFNNKLRIFAKTYDKKLPQIKELLIKKNIMLISKNDFDEDNDIDMINNNELPTKEEAQNWLLEKDDNNNLNQNNQNISVDDESDEDLFV